MSFGGDWIVGGREQSKQRVVGEQVLSPVLHQLRTVVGAAAAVVVAVGPEEVRSRRVTEDCVLDEDPDPGNRCRRRRRSQLRHFADRRAVFDSGLVVASVGHLDIEEQHLPAASRRHRRRAREEPMPKGYGVPCLCPLRTQSAERASYYSWTELSDANCQQGTKKKGRDAYLICMFSRPSPLLVNLVSQ
jgi:hypothetical protein